MREFPARRGQQEGALVLGEVEPFQGEGALNLTQGLTALRLS